LKLVLGIVSLATLALVWRCAQLVGRSPSSAVVFVGCNPIILIWGLGADHNDDLMVFFVVLAAYLLLRGKRASRGAGMSLLTAVFIKASAAVLIPIFLFASQRRRFLSGGLEAGAALGVASVIAFGLNLPDLATQSQLVTAIGLPNLLGLLLGQGGETTTVHTIVAAFLILALAGSAIWVARRPGDWLACSAVALLALVVSLSWAAPWYLLWVLPFAALCSVRHLRAITVALGVYLILAFMPAAPMLADAINFNPEATPLAVEHRREIEALVR